MRRRPLPSLAGLLLVTACGQPAAPAAPATTGLSLHPVVGVGEPGDATVDPETGGVAADPEGRLLALGPAVLSGDDVATATSEVRAGQASVLVEWETSAVEAWEALTGAAACSPQDDPTRRIAFVLDGEIVSAPVVDPSVACDQGILGGSTSLGGDLSAAEAEDLAERLSASAG